MDQILHPITLTKDFPFKSKNDVVEIFVLLRGYYELPTKYNIINERKREKNLLREWERKRNLAYTKGFRSPEIRPRALTANPTKRLFSPQKKNNNKIEEIKLEKRKRNKNIISNFLYYTFTTTYKSNKLIISETPLIGKYITKKIKTEIDLENIKNKKLKDSKIYEFDSVFNEADDISEIYKQSIETKVKRMFNGFNSCVFLMGPQNSGKTFFLIGENKIKGLLTYSINTILYYINLSKNDMISFYGIAASYVITMKVEQFYLNYRDICFKETIIFGIMNFTAILERIKETRIKISKKYSINNYIRKSHLLITFTLYQNNTGDLNFLAKNNNIQKLKYTNDIQEISKLSFIEMNDSSYAFVVPKLPNPKIYIETSNTYKEIFDISIQLSRKIQPIQPNTYFMQYLYDIIISCGTNIILFLCSNPCDPNINESSNVLKWGWNLRNNLNYGIEYSSFFIFDNIKNNSCCKYIDNYLFIERNHLEILPENQKQLKNKKFITKLTNNLKHSRYKSSGYVESEKESEEMLYSNPTTYYQTLKDFENTTKELEKMKKEQKIERDNLNDRFTKLENQVKVLKRKKYKSSEY